MERFLGILYVEVVGSRVVLLLSGRVYVYIQAAVVLEIV